MEEEYFGNEEEEEMDPLMMNDPLYILDLKQHLSMFFKQAHAMQEFGQIASTLTEAETKVLQEVLSQ